MLDFPNTPTLGQIYLGPRGATWSWDGVKWLGTTVGDKVPPQNLVVHGTTTLPPGFFGFVRVENTTGTPISVTLPILPTGGQRITIKDCLGNAEAFPITLIGNSEMLEGAPNLVLPFNYSWADLAYAGDRWLQI